MQIDLVQLSPNQLVAELNRLDVYFLQDETAPVMTAPMPPATLIMQLATSDEARLRLALIPLLLRHPEFADDVCWVVPSLSLH